jgi:hypothetical protein
MLLREFFIHGVYTGSCGVSTPLFLSMHIDVVFNLYGEYVVP